MSIMLLALLPTPSAQAQTPGQTPHHAPVNWAGHVVLTSTGSHIIGNPDAKIKLVEYMSYTCPHCAEFEAQGVPLLWLGPIQDGSVSLEVRHWLRDVVDATVAELTHCASPSRFPLLHAMFLARQEKWLAIAQHVTPGQSARWYAGTRAERMRAIAGDLGFYAIMESHGISHVNADHCLNDDMLAARLAEQTKAGEALGVTGTPSFLINGVLLAGTYDWRMLEPQLRARM